MNRVDLPCRTILIAAACAAWLGPVGTGQDEADPPMESNAVYSEFNAGQSTGGEAWVESIRVLSPEPRSTVQGQVRVSFIAPGMEMARAMVWQQPTDAHPGKWGHDVDLTDGGLALDDAGRGAFVFPAGDFPYGPTTVRIFAHDGADQRDVYELQLYNTAGVKWNLGLPDRAPPAAEGMTRVFADDFDGPLSISRDGRDARYNAHKPRFGDFSGWPFRDPDWAPAPPFAQRDTFLRIKARKPEGTEGGTGLIATVNMDGEGFWATPPCYLEARFTAQSAPGTWPAFWTITHLDRGASGDELDIAELYGGVGKGNPNHPGYSIVSHFWRQTHPDGSPKKVIRARPNITELGGGSYWSTTFHTYAVRIGLEETVYYFDDIEVLRHPTNDVSRQPHCVLLNYAIGGISGWPIDLERYGNATDMYVDYIRVYEQNPTHERNHAPPPAR